MSHGQQGDFVVELHQPLDNHLTCPRTPPLLRLHPGAFQALRPAHKGLALPGRAHHRLDEAGITNLGHSLLERRSVAGERIRRSGQSQLLCCQAANACPVHGQVRSPCRWHHTVPFCFEFNEHIGGNRFNLGNDEMRLFDLNNAAQRCPIEHRKHVVSVGNLHRGRRGVAVHGDDLHTQPLQFNRNLFAQLSRSEEQRAGRACAPRGANGAHSPPPVSSYRWAPDARARDSQAASTARFSSTPIIVQRAISVPVRWQPMHRSLSSRAHTETQGDAGGLWVFGSVMVRTVDRARARCGSA